jgi:queuine tRNA-ribosyltransferase
VLDECLAYPASQEAARVSMQRTVRWAAAGLTHHRSRFEAHFEAKGRRQALFPIVQGSMYADLRADCAKSLVDLDAEGYAIGGLSVGEPRALSMEMTEATIPELPLGRPRYVMGVGTPEELPEYVARGVDMMDCVMPTRNARNGCLFTSAGKLLIKNNKFKDDTGPVDAECKCYTCKTHTRAYLRHLFQARELQYFTLATLHNLARYLDIMHGIRQAILLGVFPQYLARVRAMTGETL